MNKPFPLTTFTKDAVEEQFFATEKEQKDAYRATNGRGDAHALLCRKADLLERNVEIKISAHERDLIIAALRLWQDQDELNPILVDIAENGRGHGGFPTDDEIDALIEDVINV